MINYEPLSGVDLDLDEDDLQTTTHFTNNHLIDSYPPTDSTSNSNNIVGVNGKSDSVHFIKEADEVNKNNKNSITDSTFYGS